LRRVITSLRQNKRRTTRSAAESGGVGAIDLRCGTRATVSRHVPRAGM
jgi:hypothetical protein